MPALHDLWRHVQRELFPLLAEEMGPLGGKGRQFVEVIALLPLGPFVQRYDWSGWGRPPCERTWMLHACVAKRVYGLATTEARIDALHGHRRPRSPRAPAARRSAGAPRRRGRPPRGEVRPPAPPTKLEVQQQRGLAENLADLPRGCDFGCQAGAKGDLASWRGYKLPLEVIDGDIPVSAVLTSASVHDSQVAIPLMQLTAQRVSSLYDLMDSAGDAPAVREVAQRLGHVPLIDPHPQRKAPGRLDPAQRVRFRERTASERVNSRLQEEFGGRTVRGRGAAKVMCHLLLGVLVVAALGIWQRPG